MNEMFNFKSAVRENLYYLLKNIHDNQSYRSAKFSFDELFDLIGEISRNDKKRFIEESIRFINKKTNIRVRVDYNKNKRKYESISFSVFLVEQYYDYKGCILNGHDIYMIYLCRVDKYLIYLSKLKKQYPNYYDFLLKGVNSDFSLLLHFDRSWLRHIDPDFRKKYIKYMIAKDNPDIWNSSHYYKFLEEYYEGYIDEI